MSNKKELSHTISKVLDSLKYQKDLKESDVFWYEYEMVKGNITANEQYRALELLARHNDIGLDWVEDTDPGGINSDFLNRDRYKWANDSSWDYDLLTILIQNNDVMPQAYFTYPLVCISGVDFDELMKKYRSNDGMYPASIRFDGYKIIMKFNEKEYEMEAIRGLPGEIISYIFDKQKIGKTINQSELAKELPSRDKQLNNKKFLTNIFQDNIFNKKLVPFAVIEAHSIKISNEAALNQKQLEEILDNK